MSLFNSLGLLPLIIYILCHKKLLIRKHSYIEAFFMFQVYKTGSLQGAVIVYLNFFFHATPLIHKCLD